MKYILLLLAPLSLFGQNYASVDKLALNTPWSKAQELRTLSHYLCDEQPNDAHKIRAIYAWVSLHIAYVDSTDERDIWATPEHLARQRPERVLQNRSAVCQGFANLFCALAAAANIPCEVVTGLAKTANGEVAPIGHAWAAAKIDGEWRLFDPTWAIPPPGLQRWKVVEKYFMAPPQTFIFQHLPDDPIWQLLEHPLTEQTFRSSSDEEIASFLLEPNEERFNFRDSLQQWMALDSTSRVFAAESRILRFNSSNERVIFGLGQGYWGLFFDLHTTLDSLCTEAILDNLLAIDTGWFEMQLTQLERYHTRARALFERLESPERMEKAEKFYTAADVAALLEKNRGDLRTGLIERQLHKMPDGVLSPLQIAQLRYQAQLANRSYTLAEQQLDCIKLHRQCFEIRHNRSLFEIQLAQRQVRFVQEMATDRTSAANIKSIQLHLSEARARYQKAIDDCKRMQLRPPRFQFVDERLAAANQGIWALQICEIRAERTALSPEVEEMLVPERLSVRKAQKLADKLAKIGQTIQHLEDTLNQTNGGMEADFVALSRTNLNIENYALQFNLANLRFRLCLNDYEAAIKRNQLPEQREQIKRDGNLALRSLKKATDALDVLEDSGRLPAQSILQKQGQITKLNKALRDFLQGL